MVVLQCWSWWECNMISVCSLWPQLPSPRLEQTQQQSDRQLDSAPALTDRLQDVVHGSRMYLRGRVISGPLWWSYGASQRGAQETMRAQISPGGLSHSFGFIHMTGYMESCVLSGCSGLKGLSDRSSRSITQVWACCSDNAHTQEIQRSTERTGACDVQHWTSTSKHVDIPYQHQY